MSKGPGRIQRAIAALIEAEPDGAWTAADLCLIAYPHSQTVMRMRFISVLRALHAMKLPGTWIFGRASSSDRRRWLWDRCSHASARKAHPGYREHVYCSGSVFQKVEEAIGWRDASDLERLDARILRTQTAMGYIGMALRAGGDIKESRAQVEGLAALLSELRAERDRLASVRPAAE
jgi:hypothetical protein